MTPSSSLSLCRISSSRSMRACTASYSSLIAWASIDVSDPSCIETMWVTCSAEKSNCSRSAAFRGVAIVGILDRLNDSVDVVERGQPPLENVGAILGLVEFVL